MIVAEDITSRFLNVIGLFNGFIPLIALKLQAIKVDGRVGLVFTRVLDEMPLGLEEEDEQTQAVTDRSYWEEKRGTPKTVKLADRVLELIHRFAPDYELKYNKFYIGLAVNGQANNFAALKPQKSALRLEIRIPKSDDTDRRIEEGEIETLSYDTRWGAYALRLSSQDISTHEELLVDLLKEAWEERT